jgi:hypothetical protein
MARRVRRSVADLRPHAARYLDQYTNPAGAYAFRTYDQAIVHDGQLTPPDVLMANLMGMRLGWRDVIPLFADGNTPPAHLRGALDAALAEARALPPLENCSDSDVEMPALAAANDLSRIAFPDRPHGPWGVVAVSKVLHRLARNVPLADQRVRSFYAVRFAGDLRRAMRDDLAANRPWLEDLAPRYPVRGQPMPLTRIADILIWMNGQ